MLGHKWEGDTPGSRLRKARIENNMTIRDLAKVTGLAKLSIINLEADKTFASLPHLRLLAISLKVSVAFLGKFESLPEKSLGQKIKKARLYHGYTKADFSRQLGVDVKTLRCWESGEHKPLKRYWHLLEQYLYTLSSCVNSTPSQNPTSLYFEPDDLNRRNVT